MPGDVGHDRAERIKSHPAIHDPVTSTAIGGGRALVVDVPLAGNGTDTASDNALLTLRNRFVAVLAFVLLLHVVRRDHLLGAADDDHRELWARGSSPKQAIVGGIASSAGVVTSAALIKVALFSMFSTLSLIDLKILGIGTAAAAGLDRFPA